MASNKDDKFSKEALKRVDDFIKKTKQAKKDVDAMDSSFGNIATQLFGISGASFFKDVPKTTEEIIQQKKEVSKLAEAVNSAYGDIGAAISKQFS